MKANDYYGHYKSFVKALADDSELTLQQYCMEQGVVWRRLYDWMRRHKISLKRLYASYRDCKRGGIHTENEVLPEFCEITPRIESRQTRHSQDPGQTVVNMSRILLPTGIVIELKDCPLSSLSVLLGQCMGKEVRNVQS